MTAYAPLEAETPFGIWARRLISIPAYFGAFLLCWSLSPLLFPVTLVWDGITGNEETKPRTRCLAFVLLYLLCEVLGLLGAAALWSVTWGGLAVSAQRFKSANYWLQSLWAGVLFQVTKKLYRVKVEVVGAESAAQSPFLLLVRHTSLADTVLAANFVAKPYNVRLRYVLKRELLWDPCLDVVGRRLPNVFIDRGSSEKTSQLADIARLAASVQSGDGILLYPEGTRFSPKKLRRILQKLEQNSHTDLLSVAKGYRHVLPPRPAGTLTVLKAAPKLDVLVLSHTGFEAAASWPSFWSGALVGQTLRIRFHRIPASEIPQENRALWLYQLWAAVDDWVDSQQERHTP